MGILDKFRPPDFGKETYKAYPIVLVRLVVGVAMFFAGFEKLIYPYWHASGAAWSSAGFLKNVAGGGIFHDWFVSQAGNGAIAPLVIWGEILIGIALIIGLLVRFSSVMGIILMGLIWLTEYMKYSGGVINTGTFGWGWNPGPISESFLFVLLFAIFMWTAAGLMYGLDKYVHELSIVKKYPWLKILFG